MCLWAAVWLVQRHPLVVAERVVFVMNVPAVLAQLLLTISRPKQAALDLASSAYWMLVALSILSVLMFGNRLALLLTGGLYSLESSCPGWRRSTALVTAAGSGERREPGRPLDRRSVRHP